MKKTLIFIILILVSVPVSANDQTPTYGLNKPQNGGDNGLWGNYLNDNADTIDYELSLYRTIQRRKEKIT